MAETHLEDALMRRLLSVVMVIVMALGMCSCSVLGLKGKKNIDIEKIKKIKGDLLVVTSYPQGPMIEKEYNSGILSSKVTYDGCAYNPFNTMGVTMSDEDFLYIYEFCIDAYENDTFRDYSEQVDDGTIYSFVYYDENGEKHTLYHGYCYANEELTMVREIIGKYSLD